MKNLHHLHVTLSENAPPRRGPITDAIPYAEPAKPVMRGRCFGLQAIAMIVYVPDPTPAPPLDEGGFSNFLGRNIFGQLGKYPGRIRRERGLCPITYSPAIARPTMRAVDVGATPQIKLPISKIRSEARKVVLSGKYLYPFPQVVCEPPKVIKYADPYQETSPRLWN